MNVKRIIRNVLVGLIYFSGVVYLYQKYSRKNGPLVRIVCFHDVRDSAWFENVVSMISTEFNIITPDEFHARNFIDTKINVLITFDDGYESWISACEPILQKYNVKALFFLSSGALDVAHNSEESAVYVRERLLLSPKKLLTWEGAQTLVKAGHTIGGHTVGHYKMSDVTRTQQIKEIVDDKQKLESVLNVSILDFAYPFGRIADYTDVTRKCAGEAGYIYTYKSESAFVLEENIDIPRTLIEHTQSPSSVRHWIKGAYDIVASANELIR